MSKLTFTRKQVATHNNTETDCWIIIDNEVYNVTEWINIHPGGKDMFEFYRGKDASIAFHDMPHSEDAYNALQNYKIGSVAESDKTTIVKLRIKQYGKKT